MLPPLYKYNHGSSSARINMVHPKNRVAIEEQITGKQIVQNIVVR